MAHSEADTKQVQDLINENKVVIFSKTWCPFCHKAKDVFKQYPSVDTKFIELDKRDDGDKLQSAVQQLTGQRTVPNVIIGGTSIGGGNEAEQAHRSGELKRRLQEVGAL